MSRIASYYCATVEGTGKFWLPYKAVVYCQHPNGQTLHFSKRMPTFRTAKFVAYVIAKSKAHMHKPFWIKEFKGKAPTKPPAI